jgi:hypothetical protein
MISSTTLHAAGGSVGWMIDDAPTYTTLDIAVSDAHYGKHTVSVFVDWDQLADLCRLLMANDNVAERVAPDTPPTEAAGPTSRPDGPGAMLADIYRYGGRITDHVALKSERRRGV